MHFGTTLGIFFLIPTFGVVAAFNWFGQVEL